VRVAMVCPYSLTRPGGVQGQATGLAAALDELGHDTVVIAPVDDGLAGATASGGVEVVPLGRSLPVPANGSVAPVSMSPAVLVRAVRAVRRGGFDVIHLHEPFAPGPGYGCLAASGLPKVATFHRSGTGFLYRAFGLPARALASRIDVRCAVSPAAEATAQAVLGGSYEVVGNGVDLERFENAAPWPTTAPTAIFIGRHERRKGLDVLLAAWDSMPGSGTENGTPAQRVLWVAGEGPETGRLRRSHPGREGLRWLGRISDEELASRLRGAHVLCAPSRGGESFGVVLLEAMAARTAVVASDIPGYAYVAGANAALVEPNKADKLSEALDRALSDAERGTGLSSADSLDLGIRNASRWSMTEVARRYAAIYERLLS
jgi:phosphatidylinositol alpha-mannosyltransferase